MKRITVFILIILANIIALGHDGFNTLSPTGDQCGGATIEYSLDHAYIEGQVDYSNFWLDYTFIKYEWTITGGTFENDETDFVSTNINNYDVDVEWSTIPTQSSGVVNCEIHYNVKKYDYNFHLLTNYDQSYTLSVTPTIKSVEPPNSITGVEVTLTGDVSLDLWVGDDKPWYVDEYIWTFTPYGGTARTESSPPYTGGDPSVPDFTLDLFGMERGTLSVKAHNDDCNATSSAISETINRKLNTPMWELTKDPICNNSEFTFHLSSVPYATSYYVESTGGLLVWDWSMYNWNTSTNSTTRYIRVIAPSSGNGNGSVIAEAKRDYLVTSDERSFTTWYGKPEQPNTDPVPYYDIQLGVDDLEYIDIPTEPGGADPYGYSWAASGSISTTSNPNLNFVFIKGDYPGYGNWSVTASNDCGVGPTTSGTADVSYYRGYLGPFKIYPNPADSYLVLEADVSKMDLSENTVTEQLVAMSKGSIIRIIDKSGVVLFSEPYYGLERTELNVSKIPSGLYTIQLITSKDVFSANLAIERN